MANGSTHGQYSCDQTPLTVSKPSIDNHIGARQKDGPCHGLDEVPRKYRPKLSIHEAVHPEHGPKVLNREGYSQDQTNPEVLEEVHVRGCGWYCEHKIEEHTKIDLRSGG